LAQLVQLLMQLRGLWRHARRLLVRLQLLLLQLR